MNKAEILQEIKKLNNLDHVSALMEWDQETYMPSSAVEQRSEQMALLAGLSHDLRNNPAFKDALKGFDTSSLSMEEKTIFVQAKRDILKTEYCSKDLLEALAKAQSKGQQAWAEAKRDDNFKHFEAHLSELLRLKMEYAESLKLEGSLYDRLIDEFETGFTSKKLDVLFDDLKEFLPTLLQRIEDSPVRVEQFSKKQSYDIYEQEDFAREVISTMGFDFKRGRIDLSEHPFCTNFSTNDVRITCNFDEHDFTRSLFSLAHEAGHGIYEQGFNPEYHATAMAQAISLGMHESQSRLWENIVARSEPFWLYFFSKLKSRFKNQFKNIKFEQFLRNINRVKADFIRIDADEVSYNLHIIIRYEIEKMLFEKEISVSELPDIWKAKYKDYLGLEVESDQMGCLQDVHWSLGLFAYFPTYSIGNIISAQLYHTVSKEIPSLDSEIEDGDCSSLKGWLNTKIHRLGKSMTSNECMQAVCNEEINPHYFKDYLDKKYSKLYKL